VASGIIVHMTKPAPASGGSRMPGLRLQAAVMIDDLGVLVRAETPSSDLAACQAGAAVVAELGTRLLGAPPERLEAGGRPHLRWRWPAGPGRPAVALIGHFDTVWPLGTLARWPFAADRVAGTATGPGCFDMKAGIVQLMHAVASLGDPDGLEILLTSDEEIGSPTSRGLVEEAARRAGAALILEPSAHGALKTGRKGTSWYHIAVTGRAAHAGLEPERGANALTELAHLILRIGEMARPGLGTTVTPTLASAGTAANVVPAQASAQIDVRVAEAAEASRVDSDMHALAAVMPGTAATVTGGPNRPPLPPQASASLFALAQEAAAAAGLPPLGGVVVGGGSDGNFTAAAGCPTLDGLGAVGDGAHAEGEYVLTGAMPERAALLANLIGALRQGSADGPG
jgi:glutamate carboxypeptidase